MLRLKLFIVLIGTFLSLFDELFVLFHFLLGLLFRFLFLFSLVLFSQFRVFLCILFLVQLLFSVSLSRCSGCSEFGSLRGGCFLLFGQFSPDSSLLCLCKGLLFSFLCFNSFPMFILLPFSSCCLLSLPSPRCLILARITINFCLSEAGRRRCAHIGFDFGQSLAFRAR